MMSVRYTAVDSMDAPALAVANDVDRNVERWREKIEVRLDNRQVFFLFFGSAVVACMLFVLGVMVGKRIESRGQAEAAPLADPLAALDRAHQPPPGVAAPEPALTFPRTLAGSQAAAPPPKAKPAAHAIVAAAPPAPKAAPAKPAPAPPVAEPAKSKGKYTLHLSTFATPAEADAFAQRYPGAFVVAGPVPGKGMVYRVRYGNFGSFKEAATAKETFEKQHNMIALVAAR
jgi:cell division septation protein DedD